MGVYITLLIPSMKVKNVKAAMVEKSTNNNAAKVIG